jgi:tRNA1Val (adenine37-N6)-methyltransferase
VPGPNGELYHLKKIKKLPRSYFRFKQFTIYQDRCAMKVCTDACLFGAWVAEQLTRSRPQLHHCLDIGTGTGLLSLMLAQNIKAEIDAVEIALPDFLQARENMEQSAWNQRLHIFHSDIKNYNTAKKYNLIVSNPPFYEKDLRAQQAASNRARHDTHLTLNELFLETDRLLQPDGLAAFLLPYRRHEECKELAQRHGFSVVSAVEVRQSPVHTAFRSMFLLNRITQPAEEETIMITNEDGNYTGRFTDLLKGYYLHL